MLLALPIQDLEIHLQLQLVDTMLIKLPLGKTCPKKLGQVHSKKIRSDIYYFSIFPSVAARPLVKLKNFYVKNLAPN